MKCLPMPARIVGARWTPRVNVLMIWCPYGRRFEHRADRWRAQCPECGRWWNLLDVRERVELE